MLQEKFRRNLATRFPAARAERIYELYQDRSRLDRLSVPDFMELLVL